MILRHILSQFTKFVLADLKYFVGYHSTTFVCIVYA